MASATKKDPIRALLAEISQALFLGNPAGTVAIMQEKVVAFGVRTQQGFDMRPKAPSKHYCVVPEDELK